MNGAPSTLQPQNTVMMNNGESKQSTIAPEADAPPAVEPPAVTPATKPLALLEVLDKSGNTVNRLLVNQWPVTVGRALTADLVVDDAHVAAEHLRITELGTGFVQVQVLNTVNGVRRGYGALMQRGMRFDWTGSDDLALGRSRLRLRLATSPVLPEQVLPSLPWKSIGISLALVLAVVCGGLIDAWFKTPNAAQFTQAAIPTIAMLLGGLALWAGVWALATKLFTGHLQFLRHVRVVCAVLLVDELVSGLAFLLAYMFSWESLARYNGLLSAPVLGFGLFLQLMVIAPQRRKGLLVLVSSTVLITVLTMAAVNWQKNKRVNDQLYLSALFPPSWRMAATVPVEQLVSEAKSIEKRLAERLKDQAEQQDDASDSAEEE